MVMSLVGTPTVTSRAEASWLLPPLTDYSKVHDFPMRGSLKRCGGNRDSCIWKL